MSKCKLCEALKNEKDKILFEDFAMVIIPTKDMKGHHKRIMAITKDHTMYPRYERSYIARFLQYAKKYFDEEPTFAFCQPTYATIKDHWHRIACDWYGTEEEIKQLHYTPHTAVKTFVKWEPKRK